VKKKAQGLFHLGGPQKYSLYDIGDYLVKKQCYDSHYLIHASRHEEENGPPRIGDVSLNSSKFRSATNFSPASGF